MQSQVAIFDERLFYHVTKLNDRDLRIDQSVNGDSLAVINAFKNIYVFNVIYHRDNTFGIYGYDDYILQDDTTIKSCIRLVGTIEMNTHGNIEVNICDERYKHVLIMYPYIKDCWIRYMNNMNVMLLKKIMW